MNHALLPRVKDAQLPAKYEAAKVAIAEASQVDECKDWADKAMAMASYARQSQDKEMEKTAIRIQARAIRRCGELLKEIEKQHGANQNIKGNASPKVLTRQEAAKDAGLSKDQAKAAVRVANIPAPKFEEQIESEQPPTVTKLAEQGTKKRVPIYEEQGMTKQAFQAGMYYGGSLRRMVEETKRFDPQDIADGCTPEEKKELRRDIEIIERFNDRIMAKL